MEITNEQKAENLSKWIRALKSGKYKQGRGELIKIGNIKTGVVYKYPYHCCLGVACDAVFNLETAIRNFDNDKTFIIPNPAESNLISEIMKEEYEINSDSPFHILTSNLTTNMCNMLGITDEQESRLISLNDDQYKTFEEISDILLFEVLIPLVEKIEESATEVKKASDSFVV